MKFHFPFGLIVATTFTYIDFFIAALWCYVTTRKRKRKLEDYLYTHPKGDKLVVRSAAGGVVPHDKINDAKVNNVQPPKSKV